MDLAYSLLIVFMLTTPLVYKELRIQVPNVAQRQASGQNNSYHSVGIDAAGHYFVNQLPVLRGELEAYFFSWSQSETEVVVEIQADADLPYQKVADIVDLLMRHRLKAVSLKVR
jgi:biopolymer transport protein ExbD